MLVVVVTVVVTVVWRLLLLLFLHSKCMRIMDTLRFGVTDHYAADLLGHSLANRVLPATYEWQSYNQ